MYVMTLADNVEFWTQMFNAHLSVKPGLSGMDEGLKILDQLESAEWALDALNEMEATKAKAFAAKYDPEDKPGFFGDMAEDVEAFNQESEWNTP